MSSSASTLPSILTMLQEKLTFYVLPFYIVLGIFGNTFCIIYFTGKSHRKSSCAFYLIIAAIVNTFAVTFGVTTNVISTWQPSTSTLIIYCKLRMYFNHSLIFLGRMLTLLASIDTYAMTSRNAISRRFSQRTCAHKFSILMFFCCPLIAVHIPIMNTVVSGQCVMTGIYSLIFAIYQMFIAGIFPPIMMMIFSCLAYHNMKKNVIVQGQSGQQIKHKHQRQLVSMVTTQIVVYILSAELVPVTTLYRTLTSNVQGKSQNQKSIESFIVFIASNFLLYLNTWAAFFIYYATSSSFRSDFIRVLKRKSRIQPLETTGGITLGSIQRH